MRRGSRLSAAIRRVASNSSLPPLQAPPLGPPPPRVGSEGRQRSASKAAAPLEPGRGARAVGLLMSSAPPVSPAPEPLPRFPPPLRPLELSEAAQGLGQRAHTHTRRQSWVLPQGLVTDLGGGRCWHFYQDPLAQPPMGGGIRRGGGRPPQQPTHPAKVGAAAVTAGASLGWEGFFWGRRGFSGWGRAGHMWSTQGWEGKGRPRCQPLF